MKALEYGELHGMVVQAVVGLPDVDDPVAGQVFEELRLGDDLSRCQVQDLALLQGGRILVGRFHVQVRPMGRASGQQGEQRNETVPERMFLTRVGYDR